MPHTPFLLLAIAVAVAWFAHDAAGQDPAAAHEAWKQMLARRIETRPDIEYARIGDRSMLLDLHLPKDRPAGVKSPVIVWIHGGGWIGGNKDNCPALAFALDGYVAASISYRLLPDHRFPAQIHDCKAAVRFLRAHAAEYGLDPERIGVWGASAGGHLAALLGTSGDVEEIEGDVGGNVEQSSRVQAVCDWFGPTNLFTLRRHFGQRDRTQSGEDETALDAQLLGGLPDKVPDKARQASPVSFVSDDDPPFLIMHGTVDPLVPVEQSSELADKLKAAGVDVTLTIYDGAGHGDGAFADPRTVLTVKEFFDRVFNQ